jgi:acetate kinase
MICLVPNIGSTSFKYRLVDMQESERVLAQARMERIGRPGGECADYAAAIKRCIAEIAGPGKAIANLNQLEAVGFKVVHAGPMNATQIIDDEFMAAMEEFSFFAAAHNPEYIAAIRAFRKVLPGTPLVAVIETAPYRQMDESTTTYGVPYAWREQHGIRRYGFHGASHRSANQRVRELIPGFRGRHISCHLGGSSSLAAFADGVAVDTSFGTSPQSGLPQSNRVGDIDAFAVLYMMKKLNLDPDQMAAVLCSQSGLAGIGGGSGDIRELEDEVQRGDKRAQLALDVFVRAIRHYLGAFMVSLGGVDAISFSGGIGENSAAIRSAASRGLAGFGIALDEETNCVLRGEGTISTEDSRVRVMVIPANEEAIIARETVAAVERVRASAAVGANA